MPVRQRPFCLYRFGYVLQAYLVLACKLGDIEGNGEVHQ